MFCFQITFLHLKSQETQSRTRISRNESSAKFYRKMNSIFYVFENVLSEACTVGACDFRTKKLGYERKKAQKQVKFEEKSQSRPSLGTDHYDGIACPVLAICVLKVAM